MSTIAYNPLGCVHPEEMEPGKLYKIPDTHETHSAYVKMPEGTVIDQNGAPSNEFYFIPIKDPAALAERLEKRAAHDKGLAEFIKKHLPNEHPHQPTSEPHQPGYNSRKAAGDDDDNRFGNDGADGIIIQ